MTGKASNEHGFKQSRFTLSTDLALESFESVGFERFFSYFRPFETQIHNTTLASEFLESIPILKTAVAEVYDLEPWRTLALVGANLISSSPRPEMRWERFQCTVVIEFDFLEMRKARHVR